MKEKFKTNGNITLEKIEEFDGDRYIFYRFQNKYEAIEGKYTQSWGRIFSSPEEARDYAEEWGMDPEDAVLPGKSCMSTFSEIMSFFSNFSDEDNVLLIFDGEDTGVSGHDGEYVSKFNKTIAVYDINEAWEFYESEY